MGNPPQGSLDVTKSKIRRESETILFLIIHTPDILMALKVQLASSTLELLQMGK